jgi:SAM-dependent methyltransferase
MNWSHYYQQPLTLEALLGNLYGQRDFLSAIYSSGAQTILEVGSGSGGMAIFLSWLGRDITSIDIEPSVVDKAKFENQSLNGRANFMVADGFALPFKEGQFDLAIHQGLLEHFSDADIRALLDEQLKCAKQVLFSVPNQNYMRRDYGNERLMTKSQWEAILSPYHIVVSRDYSPKRFPRFFLPRANIQYMALIQSKS